MIPYFAKIKHAITFQSRFSSGWPLWFEWGETLGLYFMIFLVIDFVRGYVPHPLTIAVILHTFVDFFIQTDNTSQKKLSGNLWALTIHSILSGGYPALVLGFVSGNLVIIPWSILAHFAIDASKKFGLRDPYGPVADQLAHIITLIILWRI